MRRQSRIFRAPVAILLAVGLVGIAPASASADENLLEDVVASVTEKVTPTQDNSSGGDSGAAAVTKKSATLSQPSSPPPAPTAANDDDLPGHETRDPEPPDHGGATLVEGNLGGEEVVRVGDNNATVEDDDSTTAESTLIAIGGEEVIGASADSEGENQDSFETSELTNPVCEGSEGQICLDVLYADAEATDDGRTSSSSSSSGVANACVGGDDATGATCSGPVQVGAGNSAAEAERDQRSGRTTASSESHVANACVADPETGVCQVEASALHSEGESDSGNSPATASRSSHVLMAGLGGEELVRITEPTAIPLALTEECADQETLACLFLNQGETYLGSGIAGHAQEALHVSGLPGVLDLELHIARTESLVHNDGGESDGGVGGVGGNDGNDDAVAGLGAGGPGTAGATVAGAQAAGGILPNTGGFWSGLIALALLGLGSGALLMAYSRRRMGAIA